MPGRRGTRRFARHGHCPLTVTVVSPPERRTGGGFAGRPCAFAESAIPASAWPTSRASPSMASPRMSGVTPAARATFAAASRLASGEAMISTRERARRGSPGFGVSSAAVGEVARHRRRRIDAVAGKHGAGVAEGGRVGDRRPRSDDARIVAGHVGDERLTVSAGKAAAASRPPLIAERCFRTVFIAVMSAPEASSARLTACFSSRRDPLRRQGEQRRAAARNQAEHQVVRPGAFGEREDAARSVAPARVGDRVRGLDDLDPLAGYAMAGPGDDQALERAVPVVLDRLCHRGRSFPCPEDDDPALRPLRQVRRHHPGRQRRGDGCVEEGEEESTGFGFRFRDHGTPFLAARITF